MQDFEYLPLIFLKIREKLFTLQSEPPRLNLTRMMKKAVELFVKKMCTLLRIRRYALGWSQSKLHRTCETDSCRIENGKTDPTVSRFVRLCRGLGISPGWLLVLSEMIESGALSERELIEVIKNWDDYKKIFIAMEYKIVKSIAEKQEKSSKAG